LNGRILVGHNIGVDLRLIHLRMPAIQPAALIDTSCLVRHLWPDVRRWNLTALLAEHELENEVKSLVPDGQPHRALWDAVGSALLLAELAAQLPDKTSTTLAALTRVAGLSYQPVGADQLTLDVSDSGGRT
jgi:DNA polymerase-3 subunit epsilon/exodeoxyribonuclease X